MIRIICLLAMVVLGLNLGVPAFAQPQQLSESSCSALYETLLAREVPYGESKWSGKEIQWMVEYEATQSTGKRCPAIDFEVAVKERPAGWVVRGATRAASAETGSITGNDIDATLKRLDAECDPKTNRRACFEYFELVKMNDPQAYISAEWLAENINADYYFVAGEMLDYGRYKTPVNKSRAFANYTLACDRNHKRACFAAADMLYSGDGIVQNRAKANYLASRACTKSLPQACRLADATRSAMNFRSSTDATTVRRAANNYGQTPSAENQPYCYNQTGANNRTRRVCVTRDFARRKGWIK
ncbi:sel1 repeat family protein [Pontixanthobacter sp. CEM42]|uniref:tetratricopeptide repeat protein n=1 Tax=Pontixanthobacter sp. CEM42 TaxID=2792077 RepID=UPI001AE07A1E|nr:sel1 repeat family protein [Pontixanthobacter sp. CEM42]